MEFWRELAIETLPLLKDDAIEARTLFDFCWDLTSLVDECYEELHDGDPFYEETLCRIFDYAKTCFGQAISEDDEDTCRTLAGEFYRDLFYGKVKRRDVHNRLSKDLFEDLLGWWGEILVDDEEYERFKRDYYSPRRK